jgi:hypothetical protein
MKKIIASLMIAGFVGSIAVAQVPNPENPTETQEMVQQDQKTEITLDKVPAKVKESLKSNDYEIANVETIYEMTAEGKKVYKFIVLDGSQKWAVDFDATGKLLGEKKVDA